MVDRIRYIKATLPITEAVSVLTGIDFQESGSTAWPSGEDICPCGEHTKNFRINVTAGYCKCFTPGCNRQGDLIDFTKEYFDTSLGSAVDHLEMVFEAELNLDGLKAATSIPEVVCDGENLSGERIAGSKAAPKTHGITNPIESDFKAMGGYQTIFQWGMTPSSAGYRHMVTQRRHDPVWLAKEGVGFLDQGLGYRLHAKTSGKTSEQMARYGLLTMSGGDIARRGLVTFPLKDRDGRVCGFRFKDPEKKYMAQQRREGILNGVVFLGEHTLKALPIGSRVLVVEGEHDWLSLREAGWDEGLLATCGQLSRVQVGWLRENLGGYQLVTAFDNDHAGEVYRQEIADHLTDLNPIQYVPPTGDPDEYLKCVGTLSQLISEGSLWVK